MWLSHHQHGDRERCLRVGRVHVCRRCLVLYPIALVVCGAWLARPGGDRMSGLAMWVLPIPVVIEWTAEHAWAVAYSARRQVVLTALAAPGLGVALATWSLEPFSLRVVLPMTVHVVVCLCAWGVGQARPRGAPLGASGGVDDGVGAGWEAAFDAAEAERLTRLAALVGVGVGTQPGSVTKSMSSSTEPTSDGSRSL